MICNFTGKFTSEKISLGRMSYSTSRPLASTRRPVHENMSVSNYVLLNDGADESTTLTQESIHYSHPIHGEGTISFPDVLVQNIGRDQFLAVPICYANENAKIKQPSRSQTPVTVTKSPTNFPPLGSESLGSSHSSFSIPKSEVNTTTARPTFNAKPINISGTDAGSEDGATTRTSVGLRLQGRRVEYVIPGGPAFLTGKIKENDEIIAVDGSEISLAELVR